METWQVLLGIAGICVPAIIAMFARDRALFSTISTLKDDLRKERDERLRGIHEKIDTLGEGLTSRMDRIQTEVRDQYVHRRDFDGLSTRIEAMFRDMKSDHREALDEMKAEIRRGEERREGLFKEIQAMINAVVGIKKDSRNG